MTVGYTADGEQFTATYDAENRLVSLTSTSHSMTFTYGYDGFLVKQVEDGVETRFVNCLPLPSRERAGERGRLVLQERNSSNAVTRTYAWDPASPGGIGGLLEMTDSTGTYSYMYDGKGNVRALTDSSQNVVASYAYDELGRLAGKTGTLGTPDEEHQGAPLPEDLQRQIDADVAGLRALKPDTGSGDADPVDGDTATGVAVKDGAIPDLKGMIVNPGTADGGVVRTGLEDAAPPTGSDPRETDPTPTEGD